MNLPMLGYEVLNGVGLIVVCSAAVWCARLNPENLPKFEPWPRNRLWGMILGWIALLLCVPHARVVSPDFLLPLLWPLAVGIPILSYFFLDYCLARAVGGAMILWAYYWIWYAFALKNPLMAAIAPAAWIWGAAGIWISGRPCALRDWIRLCARDRRCRWGSVVFLTLFALVMAAGMLTALKG